MIRLLCCFPSEPWGLLDDLLGRAVPRSSPGPTSPCGELQHV